MFEQLVKRCLNSAKIGEWRLTSRTAPCATAGISQPLLVKINLENTAFTLFQAPTARKHC
jgi:hypothetical protein